ncbi:unnamed protein product, partial [marine sediment metagenome]
CRGMWQQSKKGSDIVEWAENKFGEKPIHMYPVITLFSSLMVDAVVRKAYLNSIIDAANLYDEDFWEKPQWVNIADLESLSQIAEDGKLDIEALLSEKNTKSVNNRFDMFLSSKKSRIIHMRVHDEMLELLDQSCLYFFDRKLKRENRKVGL